MRLNANRRTARDRAAARTTSHGRTNNRTIADAYFRRFLFSPSRGGYGGADVETPRMLREAFTFTAHGILRVYEDLLGRRCVNVYCLSAERARISDVHVYNTRLSRAARTTHALSAFFCRSHLQQCLAMDPPETVYSLTSLTHCRCKKEISPLSSSRGFYFLASCEEPSAEASIGCCHSQSRITKESMSYRNDDDVHV